MTSLRRLLAPVLASLLLLVAIAPAASATEGSFAAAIASERASRGLSGLATKGDLTTVARRHSTIMADANHLHHNPTLGSSVTGWQKVGENVGRGPSVGALHDAFMASPGHRRNILDPDWTEVGVGVVVRDGTIWVTVVFRRPLAPKPAPAPAPKPAPKPAPAPAPAPAPEPAPEPAPAPEPTPEPTPRPAPAPAPAKPPLDWQTDPEYKRDILPRGRWMYPI